MSDPIQIETDDEAADILATNFGSKGLRALASNAGVSRERGDGKRATAEKIVAQDPALAARVIEADPEVDMGASAFREAREVGEGHISIDEAANRARHKGTRSKLESLERSVASLGGAYEAEVDWEYGSSIEADPFRGSAGYRPGLTSIRITASDDLDANWMLEGRARVILRPHGRCVDFEVDSGTGGRTYVDKNSDAPSRGWRVGLRALESLYDGD